ncbi:DNA (cytosine-5)-methyltransferase DRM2-like isoform X2 [Diospyros lotus]|uniref:DNA (cytosine-5)-methyltransferase DRM2-like isoform X2 n=1 Tax=Diospyros lotus TaxID=55363 RepID=UPI00225B3ACB|nr:DNA (cytosine-5)-methyltransferase DRM2-like isoform X2 [Diospyros lotus]
MNMESKNFSLEKDRILSILIDMGYQAEEAMRAINANGMDAPVADLADFICASQVEKGTCLSLREPPCQKGECSSSQQLTNSHLLKSKTELETRKRKLQQILEQKPVGRDKEVCRLPNPMIGFGVPGEPLLIVNRVLPNNAMGPPYFYYENVAFTPKGVWSTISKFLFDIKPEFVDSKYLCAAARKRGYVHNLPIQGRFQLLPPPPLTIHEALPLTKKWWPSWDTRTKLNCLVTCVASAKLTERIKKALEKSDGEPPANVKKFVLEKCKKWNLIWVGKNKAAPLDPDELEKLMGFPRNHTRGFRTTERYTMLGNSFHVDTVAFHLSVLKELFPSGINVLSLFSGIGGAEVALHRLGIPLKNVVSIEKSKTCHAVVRCWWEETNQQGNLIHIVDVNDVTPGRIAELIASFGGFDLVIGGSPCNNLAGGNRVSRDGLEGKESSLFFQYPRILNLVKSMMNLK